MKIIKTIVLISLTLSLSAQTPNYFENNPEWRQSADCADGLPCVEEQDYVYYINGDSIVNDTIYQKIYKHGILVKEWYDSPPIPPSCDTSWNFNHFYALVRQEEKRIYFRQWGDPEVLLYDFELEVGDTLPITWNQWHEDIIVTGIDSLLVGSSFRKVFNLTQQSSPQLIEGIGHEGGFIEPFPPILECGNTLLCFALDNITYYPNFNDPCDLTVNILPVKSQEIIKYYPNPVIGELTIEYDNFENIEQVVSLNASGQKKVLAFTKNGENKINIDLSNLGKGLYVIQIIGKGKSILNLKVIKD